MQISPSEKIDKLILQNVGREQQNFKNKWTHVGFLTVSRDIFAYSISDDINTFITWYLYKWYKMPS